MKFVSVVVVLFRDAPISSQKNRLEISSYSADKRPVTFSHFVVSPLGEGRRKEETNHSAIGRFAIPHAKRQISYIFLVRRDAVSVRCKETIRRESALHERDMSVTFPRMCRIDNWELVCPVVSLSETKCEHTRREEKHLWTSWCICVCTYIIGTCEMISVVA